MGLWAKSVVIINAIRAHGQQSIRGLADRTGLSKSSVHRHLQAIDCRDRYPESSFWETEAGRAWRQRLSNVSRMLHPWQLVDSTRQTSQEVEEQLRAELE